MLWLWDATKIYAKVGLIRAHTQNITITAISLRMWLQKKKKRNNK